MFEAITLTLLHTCSQSVHVMQHALLDQTIYVHKAIAFARRVIDYDLTYLKMEELRAYRVNKSVWQLSTHVQRTLWVH